MPPIDWMQVGGVALGAGLGSYLGYRLMRNRPPASPRTRAHMEAAWHGPARQAAFLAMSAFLGCAVVEDVASLLGRERPGGFFLAKYVFALSIGIANYAHLRRSSTRAAENPVA